MICSKIVERHRDTLLALEQRVQAGTPNTDEELKACIQKARDDVDHPGANLSLVEAMHGKPNGKPEPTPAAF